MKFLVNIALIVVVSLCSCNNDHPGTLESETADSLATGFKWIEGKFVVTNEESGFYYEEWKKTDNTNYTGYGCFLTRDCIDTIFSMKMRLIHTHEKTILFYDVKGQNENKETEFTLTKGENGIYVFENPFRDFPSIMQYKIIGDSVIEVTERGFENNKEKVVEYKASRID